MHVRPEMRNTVVIYIRNLALFCYFYFFSFNLDFMDKTLLYNSLNCCWGIWSCECCFLIIIWYCFRVHTFSWLHEIENLSCNQAFSMASFQVQGQLVWTHCGLLLCGMDSGKIDASCHQEVLQESIPGSNVLWSLQGYLKTGLPRRWWSLGELLETPDSGCSCPTVCLV